jgi:hypothetical protein
MTFSFQDWIEHIRHLMPISGIVHIGAGAGRETLQYAGWSVPSAVFIEADETYAEKLTAAMQSRPGWTSHTALISDSEGEKAFYLATNPSESGVLQPENLSRFWRNLKTRESRPIKTTTLDALLASSDGVKQITNYAVIACLPALPVLQGAKNSIAEWDVIIARVILDESQLPDQGARKSELDSYLNALGYICIASEEENQPALGHALYIRDWKTLFHSNRSEHQAQIQHLNQARDEQAKVAAEWQGQIQQLTQARDEQAKLAAEGQGQIQQLTQARDEQAKLAAEWQAQIQQLSQARNEQAKLAAEGQAQIQQLTQARDEQAKLAAESQAHIQQLTQARDEQASLAAERQRQLDEMQQRLKQIEGQNAEFAKHQTLLQEEMVRAEAQIELIKDVLLREPGL